MSDPQRVSVTLTPTAIVPLKPKPVLRQWWENLPWLFVGLLLLLGCGLGYWCKSGGVIRWN